MVRHSPTRRPGRLRLGRTLAAVGSVAILVVVSACGTNSAAGSGTSPSAGSSAASAPASAGSSAGSSAAAPTGTPIKTVTVSAIDYNGPTYESIQVTAKLYEQWINARGGINGHPLEVTTCDDKGDPTQTAACARQAVSDGVVADIGTFTYNAAVAVPIYEQASVAVLGNCCNLSEVEYTSPNTFQMGNNPALNPSGVAQAVQDGCQNIGVLELDLPSTDDTNILYDNVAKAYGYTGEIKYVRVPLTTQDYTSQVAQITDGTDCIAMFLSESNIAGMMPAFAQTGGTQRLYGAQGNFDKVSIKGFETLPGVADGVVYGAYPPLNNDVWKDFREAIATYDAPADLEYNSLSALGTWAAFTAFTQVVEEMDGEITAPTVLAALSKATVDTGGMTPVIDFTKTWDAFNGQYLRAFSRQVTYFKIGDESQIGDSVYTDLTDPLQGLPPAG